MTSPCITENIPIDQIQLDKNNPRIAQFIAMYRKDPTPEQISLALGSGGVEDSSDSTTTFRGLKESIRTNSGIIHPIIVNKISDGKYVAIEGNTRLAIYQDFRDNKVKGIWDTIPAIVYEDMSKKQIDSIRLQAHLVGPRPWDPYSKARYLNRLRNEDHLTWEQIVDYCGGNRKEAESYVAAYEDMENYYRKVIDDDSDFDVTRFSGFVELQKKSNIKPSILKAGFTLTDFAKWIKDELLYPLYTVRKLPDILSNKKTKNVFLRDGAKEAIKRLEVPLPDSQLLKDTSLKELANLLAEKLRKIDFSEVKKFRRDPSCQDYQGLLDVKEELDDLCSFVADEK